MPAWVTRNALAAALAFLGTSRLTAACNDHDCYGVNVCSTGGECVAPTDCTSSNIKDKDDKIEIRGQRCRVTLEALHQALPEYVTTDGQGEYTLHKKLFLRDGCVLEIHGGDAASSPEAAVSTLRLKVRPGGSKVSAIYLVMQDRPPLALDIVDCAACV